MAANARSAPTGGGRLGVETGSRSGGAEAFGQDILEVPAGPIEDPGQVGHLRAQLVLDAGPGLRGGTAAQIDCGRGPRPSGSRVRGRTMAQIDCGHGPRPSGSRWRRGRRCRCRCRCRCGSGKRWWRLRGSHRGHGLVPALLNDGQHLGGLTAQLLGSLECLPLGARHHLAGRYQIAALEPPDQGRLRLSVGSQRDYRDRVEYDMVDNGASSGKTGQDHAGAGVDDVGVAGGSHDGAVGLDHGDPVPGDLGGGGGQAVVGPDGVGGDRPEALAG